MVIFLYLVQLSNDDKMSEMMNGEDGIINHMTHRLKSLHI